MDSAETSGRQEAPARDVLADVCGEIAGAVRRAWGRGPQKTTARWAGPDVLVVLMVDGHTDAEKTLRADGHVAQLLEGRQLLQLSLEDDVKACVESATGRSVITILSATRLNPDLSAEIFLLEPDGLLPSDDRGQQARTRASELGEESKAVIAQALHVLARTDARHKSEESPEGAEPPPAPPAAD